MEIKIPFNVWSIGKLNADFKNATSRYKKYGSKGDIFYVDGNKYIILLVVKLPLWMIANYLYNTEGCNSPNQFINIWETIHPQKGFKKDDEVWYHLFDKIEERDSNQKTLEFKNE